MWPTWKKRKSCQTFTSCFNCSVILLHNTKHALTTWFKHYENWFGLSKHPLCTWDECPYGRVKERFTKHHRTQDLPRVLYTWYVIQIQTCLKQHTTKQKQFEKWRHWEGKNKKIFRRSMLSMHTVYTVSRNNNKTLRIKCKQSVLNILILKAYFFNTRDWYILM